MAYNYYREITIDHTKVEAAETDFEFMFSATIAELKTTSNGGHVENANGYDIVFSPNTDGSSKYDHEVEKYDPTTGEFVAWVRIPSLSAGTDTTLYLVYGDDSISSSQENVAGVWESDRELVLHLSEDPSGSAPQAQDSSGNDRDGSSNGSMTSGDLVEAACGDGWDLDGSDDFIEVDWMGISGANDRMVEIIIKTSNTSDQALVAWGTTNSGEYYEFRLDGVGGGHSGRIEVDGGYVRWATILTDGNLHYLVLVFSGTDVVDHLFYVDGDADTVDASDAKAINTDVATNNVHVGCRASDQSRVLEGIVDEVRVTSGTRDADWIKTTANNLLDPGNFFSVGAEQGEGPEPTRIPRPGATLGSPFVI